jgi:hypothetical protein
VIAAWYDDPKHPHHLTIIVDHQHLDAPLNVWQQPATIPTNVYHQKPLRILRTHTAALPPTNTHQLCQDEPVRLGTQIQPAAADWLGTAGAPAKWLDKSRRPHWGILSNWHVMADGDQRIGRTQHQPTTSQGPIAALANWHQVTPDRDHKLDAAIADALLDAYHTISNEILGLGPLGDHPIDAHVGLAVSKSGRTTMVTHGTCLAIGATVRVSYGDFTATLVDQDVYAPANGPFSAPGDSGSLILTRDSRCPCSLLFAGNDLLTIANPIRHVAAELKLVFPFP